MEAKDTVIDISENKYDGLGADTLVELQAEISFKAGIKEVVEWINQEEHLLYVPEGDEEPIDHGILLRPSKWQAKLKEWGVK